MLSQMADMANSVYMVFHIVSTVNVPVPAKTVQQLLLIYYYNYRQFIISLFQLV